MENRTVGIISIVALVLSCIIWQQQHAVMACHNMAAMFGYLGLEAVMVFTYIIITIKSPEKFFKISSIIAAASWIFLLGCDIILIFNT